MRNLYERLKSEYKGILEDNKEEYPNICEYIEEQFRKNNYVRYVEYGAILDMKCIISDFRGFDPYNLFEDN